MGFIHARPPITSTSTSMTMRTQDKMQQHGRSASPVVLKRCLVLLHQENLTIQKSLYGTLQRCKDSNQGRLVAFLSKFFQESSLWFLRE